jgi:hypothetical protein
MYFGRRAGGRRKRGAASFSSQHNNISPERFNARPVREIQGSRHPHSEDVIFWV